MTGVRLASGQLVNLARHMICGAVVHVPGRIHRIRGSEPRLLGRHSSLLLVSFPIVPDAKEVALEAAVAARRQVPLDAAELTLNPTATCLAGEPLAPSRGGGGGSGRAGLVGWRWSWFGITRATTGSIIS